MTLTCTSIDDVSVLPSGKIQLVLNEAQRDATEEKLFIPEIAKMLCMSSKTVQRLSSRKRNPLPLVRGKGRPFGFRSTINQWINSEHIHLHLNAVKVFGKV